MPDVSQIVDTIDQSNLVADEVLDELRARLEKSPQTVDLKTAVKWLVQKEHITSDQGRRLLSKAGGAAGAAKTARPAPADDDLQLVDDPSDAPPAKAPANKAPAARPSPAAADDELDDDLELFPLDDAAAEAVPERAARPPAQPKRPAAQAKEPAARWAGTPKQRPAPAPARRPQAAPANDAPAPSNNHGYGEADADLFDAAEQAGYAEEQPARGARQRQKVGGGGSDRSIWDTKLLLLGGGGLLLIVIAIGVLLWRIGRLSGDEMFTKAEEAWKSGSHTQAISQYDKFLEQFPEHAEAGPARVHRGLARMRQAVEGSRDFTKTLTAAKEILKEIAPEEKFGEAQDELRALLPQIAEGLAKQASEKQDLELIKQAEETLALVEKYIRKSGRPEQRLADVRASLELTKRTIGRDAALKEAVVGIEKSIADNAPQRAYQIRKELLKQYPTLAGDESLRAAVLSLSKAEQASVVFHAEAKPAAPADEQSPIEAQVVTADRHGRDAPGVKGQLVPMLAGGAAYVFEADSGQILWRRFVGHDTNYVPRPIGVEGESDLLLVDSQRHEVQRIERRGGKLKWRFVVGEPFDAHPVVAREHVWLATRQGKLYKIELDSGNSPGYVQLPQGLRVGPAFDSGGQFCYQLGENSNLFALSTGTLQCQEVLYLGHEPESVHVPPVVVGLGGSGGQYVFVVEDQGVHHSLLHILMADSNGANIRQAQEAVPLSGHVLAPLEAAGRTLVVATDRGGVYSFEINPPDPGPPLVKVAEKPADDREPLVRYPLLNGTQLWIAGNGITKYDVLASRGKLEPRSTKDEGDIFLERPALVGNILIHARRRGQEPGVVVAAVSAEDGTRYWETTVSAPPAGAPLSDAASGRMLLFNRAGALFAMPADDLFKGGVQNSVAAASELGAALSGPVAASLLADGGVAVSSASVGAKALVAGKTGPRRWLPLPDVLGAPAVAFHGGLLAPGKLGQVRVVDPATGADLVQPFQPRLGRGPEYRWSTPLVMSNDELLLADGDTRLYRLGVAAKPEPHLTPVAEAELKGPLAAPLAVAGATVYAVNGANELVAFSLGQGGAKTLAAGKSWPLAAPVVWGPYTAGPHVLLATLDDHLLACGDAQNTLWQVEWKHGPLSGTPLLVGDALLLPTKSGQLCKLAAASGDVQGVVELGEPLAAGPVALGDRLLLAAKSGALLVVTMP